MTKEGSIMAVLREIKQKAEKVVEKFGDTKF